MSMQPSAVRHSLTREGRSLAPLRFKNSRQSVVRGDDSLLLANSGDASLCLRA